MKHLRLLLSQAASIHGHEVSVFFSELNNDGDDKGKGLLARRHTERDLSV